MNQTEYWTDAELRDQTRNRDSRSIAPFEVHFTHPDPWVRDLEKDAAAGAIDHNVVRTAVTSSPAHWSQAPGSPQRAFDTRPMVWHRSRYVEASYVARGQMVKLSAYCGIAWSAAHDEPESSRPWSEATGLLIQAAARRVLVAMSRIPDLDVRNGESLHLHAADPWVAGVQEQIDPLPELNCATCLQPVYYANGLWRHRGDSRAEAFDRDVCPECDGRLEVPGLRGRMRRCGRCAMSPGEILILNHLADPDEAGRKI